MVFAVPKVLRNIFLHDRKLLRDLSQCAWRVCVSPWATLQPHRERLWRGPPRAI